jgi:hypothetical protein
LLGITPVQFIRITEKWYELGRKFSAMLFEFDTKLEKNVPGYRLWVGWCVTPKALFFC